MQGDSRGSRLGHVRSVPHTSHQQKSNIHTSWLQRCLLSTCTRSSSMFTQLVLKVQRPVQVRSSYVEGAWGLVLWPVQVLAPWSSLIWVLRLTEPRSVLICAPGLLPVFVLVLRTVLCSCFCLVPNRPNLQSGFRLFIFSLFNRLFPPVVLLWFLLTELRPRRLHVFLTSVSVQDFSLFVFWSRVSEPVVKYVDQIPWNT